jgi:hypothetical protein
MLATQFTEDCYQNADEFMVDRSVLLLTDGNNIALSEYARNEGKHVELLKLPIPQ